MDACFGEWGFVQFGEMLQYMMDYEMNTDAVETLVRRAVEIDVPVQVHVSTSNAKTGASSFGDEQLQDLFRLVQRVPEARYVLAHLIGSPKGDPPVATGYLDAIDKEYGEFPRNFWAEIRDFDSPGVRTALDRVPGDRLIAGTDWTTRIGPPFMPYGMVFGSDAPEENPYPPSIQSIAELLTSAGCADEQIRRIGWQNATELYDLKE